MLLRYAVTVRHAMGATAAPPPVLRSLGRGVPEGFLSSDEVAGLISEGLSQLDLDGKRVLAIVPDGTRTMPMLLVYGVLERDLGPRAAQLDVLIALGTHAPMDDSQLSRHLGRQVIAGSVDRTRVFNHRWNDPDAFATLGTIPASEIENLTGGVLRQDVPVSLNKSILNYDHLLVCGPVFPHEVAAFSGGSKYFFPGIAGPES